MWHSEKASSARSNHVVFMSWHIIVPLESENLHKIIHHNLFSKKCLCQRLTRENEKRKGYFTCVVKIDTQQTDQKVMIALGINLEKRHSREAKANKSIQYK